MRNFLLTSLLVLFTLFANAQTSQRTLSATRTVQPIKIDGEINDEAWKSAPAASNFTEWRPTFGKKEDDKTKTDLFILYDNEAIYLGGLCREASRDSISTELVGRDVIGVNDFIGVMFDTYQDKINGVGYYVTALGEQYDAKYSLNNEDGSWNSVWQSATKITDKGWTFEIRIPYSAIRFSKKPVQDWGINFIRRRNKVGKQYSWNPIDPNQFGLLNQAGLWKNIENIKPPLRLSFSPYFSTYLTHTAGATTNQWKNSVNGGMDVKYGINKAFTLDMTLIPDFGQVQSDNLVLNLSPFEVKYNENRTFFTEGTELFNKGNLFYSRRIGGQPIHYYDVYSGRGATDVVTKNPTETKLINATKISGRTAKGLGIGIFNAVTKPQYALIDNGKEEVEIETNPLTNYNVLVLDQTMKNNSSVTLVNTNVWRSGKDYDANVTAALWDLYDKNINWNFWGRVGTSQLVGYTAPGKTYSGNTYQLNVGKFKGPFNFFINQYFADNKYQQNDLGYFTNNNYFDHNFYVGYKLTKPKHFYNNLFFNLNGSYSQRYLPRSYQYVNFNGNINGQLKNLWNVGITGDIRPQQNDFYEPRMAGKVFKNPTSWMRGFWVNSNKAKKYSYGLDFYWRTASKYNYSGIDLTLRNQYRFNDKLTIALSSFMGFGHNNLGFAFINNARDSVMFGLRDRHTVENILNVKYNFNNKMGINFRTRHYWSKVDYSRFYKLQDNGDLQNVASVNRDPNSNVNYFNIDMIYTWQFAQGSFINVAWKNAANVFDQNVAERYYHNLNNTLNTPQENSFSVKIIYYLDYLSLKSKG